MNWDDKEDRKAYFREYYKKNKERILSRVKKYRSEGKEKKEKKYDFPEDIYMKCYYEENKEKMKETSKQWKKDNRDKWNEYQREKAREYYQKKKKEKEYVNSSSNNVNRINNNVDFNYTIDEIIKKEKEDDAK